MNTNDQKALNCLAFLYYHGIEVGENKEVAKNIFNRSSNCGNYAAKFILTEGFDYEMEIQDNLFEIANEGYGNVINSIALKLDKN